MLKVRKIGNEYSIVETDGKRIWIPLKIWLSAIAGILYVISIYLLMVLISEVFLFMLMLVPLFVAAFVSSLQDSSHKIFKEKYKPVTQSYWKYWEEERNGEFELLKSLWQLRDDKDLNLHAIADLDSITAEVTKLIQTREENPDLVSQTELKAYNEKLQIVIEDAKQRQNAVVAGNISTIAIDSALEVIEMEQKNGKTQS